MLISYWAYFFEQKNEITLLDTSPDKKDDGNEDILSRPVNRTEADAVVHQIK